MIPCFSCAYEACSRCVKKFLTSTPTDPSCMNCHHAWPREFLDEHLTRSWLEGELKLHRATILFDRERSLLPSTQPDLEIERQKRVYAERRPALLEKRRLLLEEITQLEIQIQNEQRYIRAGPTAASEPKERRQFVAACPIEACRGFLSTAYKCGTCTTQFCSACREKKSADTEHTCDLALVATIAEILKDSRPCPHCGTAISKVRGCDQMYCTQCDTAFAYSTGKVVTGVIHNPHYFERMRKLKEAGAGAPAGGGAGAGACNGWPNWHHLPAPVRKNDRLRNLLQAGIHTAEVVIPDLPTPEAPTDNRDLRVRYLMNELDEKKFKQLIQQRDRRRQRDIELRAVHELFAVTVLEFFHTPATLGDEKAFGALQAQIETTINAPFKAIGDRYANRVPLFDVTTCRFVWTTSS